MFKLKFNITKHITIGLLLLSLVVCAPVTVKASTVYQTNQTVTGYTGSGTTAWGLTPKIGYVAVHPKLPTRYANDKRALDPIIPFGTVVNIMNDPIPTPNGSKSMFIVADTGDTNYHRYNVGRLILCFLKYRGFLFL
ncbi:hypothetical protein [Clostridium tetani]|uniref:hypothetical protein n=1 Tax=Clostridium tetani TaxID=1513 RepID=UPI0024A7B3CA|nr:hypothetical protein [Clostridium tetani]